MKNKRWQNIALGVAFTLPVIGAYLGKRMLSKAKKHKGETLPEVTRIRIPITSLIGINEPSGEAQDERPSIVLPADETNGIENTESILPPKPEISYIASTEGEKFHNTDCRWAQNIKEENSIRFKERSVALEQGYKPCGSCSP